MSSTSPTPPPLETAATSTSASASEAVAENFNGQNMEHQPHHHHHHHHHHGLPPSSGSPDLYHSQFYRTAAAAAASSTNGTSSSSSGGSGYSPFHHPHPSTPGGYPPPTQYPPHFPVEASSMCAEGVFDYGAYHGAGFANGGTSSGVRTVVYPTSPSTEESHLLGQQPGIDPPTGSPLASGSSGYGSHHHHHHHHGGLHHLQYASTTPTSSSSSGISRDLHSRLQNRPSGSASGTSNSSSSTTTVMRHEKRSKATSSSSSSAASTASAAGTGGLVVVPGSNKKERRRTQSINNAFSNLRDCIPNVPCDTKLSKIKTLRLATSYIDYLLQLLNTENNPGAFIEGFKADIHKKWNEKTEEQKRRELEAELNNNGGNMRLSRSTKGGARTGWPQHVWALELKH